MVVAPRKTTVATVIRGWREPRAGVGAADTSRGVQGKNVASIPAEESRLRYCSALRKVRTL